MSEQATTDPVGTGEYTHQQILTIISGLMLGMFLGALDQTIVSTSIRTISDSLHGLSAQAWVTTAYLVTSTITTPIYGKLGDLWGRKKLFMFAITVFIIGSLLCTLSTSMYELAAFRAFQGLGAGGLFTLVLAIIGDIVPPLQRAKYTGYFMAAFGSASVLGPVVGGLLAGADSIFGVAGWRWVFLVNVPVGLVALVVVYRTLHVQHTRRAAKVDVLGAAALTVCLVPLLVVCEQGRDWGWTSGRSVLMFMVAALGLVGFVWVEKRAGLSALIPLQLFRIRAASVTIVASVIVGMGMFGGMMVLPLYMQIVHGASPMKSGLLMLPLVAGLMCASFSAGQIISRTGKTRLFPIFGASAMSVGLFLLTTITADTALWQVDLFMFVLGFGVGNCMQPMILTVQSAVPPQAIGVATSSATFFRQIGGTIGVAVFLSMLFGGLSANMQDRIVAESATSQAASHQADLGQIANDSSRIAALPQPLQHAVKAGFADSMTPIFWLAGGFGVLAVGVLLFMPEVELRKTSANAAVRQAAAAASE